MLCPSLRLHRSASPQNSLEPSHPPKARTWPFPWVLTCPLALTGDPSLGEPTHTGTARAPPRCPQRAVTPVYHPPFCVPPAGASLHPGREPPAILASRRLGPIGLPSLAFPRVPSSGRLGELQLPPSMSVVEDCSFLLFTHPHLLLLLPSPIPPAPTPAPNYGSLSLLFHVRVPGGSQRVDTAQRSVARDLDVIH